MNRSIHEMQRQIELMLNEIGADQKVFRVTLQCFLLGVAKHRPDMLPDLKGQVLATIKQTPPHNDAAEAQGAERHKQLTLMRAEQFRASASAISIRLF